MEGIKIFCNGKSAGDDFHAESWQLKDAIKMKKTHLIISAFVALAGFLSQGNAQGFLNNAGSFAVLGGATVTSTGNTVLNGDLGVSPGTAITGFTFSTPTPGPGIVNGTTDAGGAFAATAQTNIVSAYNHLAGEVFTQNLTGQDLGGLTTTPGVYHFDTSAQLTGILVLDAQGDSNARFDFQIGSTLISASGAAVHLINGAQAGNVFWQVGTSATLGVDTSFYGSILADQSITLNTAASLIGRALAMNGAVTLDNNLIGIPTSVPEPNSFWLLIFSGSVFGGWRWLMKRRRQTKQS